MSEKRKGSSNPLLRMFENENERHDEFFNEIESLPPFEAAKAFAKLFAKQSSQRKIVWILRVLGWILLLGLAAYGYFLKVKK